MNIDMQSEIEHYDDIYSRHTGAGRCLVSVSNLTKARTRVLQVMKTFGISLKGARVLDIGCGLGYIAEALRLEGATVVGLDASAVAIRRAAGLFPDVTWRQALFPQEFSSNEKFDLVWVLDVSALNTFNVAEMKSNLLDSALESLNPGGRLIVGWHTDLSGRVKRNFSHWPFSTVCQLRRVLSFTGPRVVQVRFGALSWLILLLCKIIGKSCPIYFMRTVTVFQKLQHRGNFRSVS
jgi:2-polyprenyl-3-methyl-5-hydroxy-6-metoxy-1,4-benzoquinol methylase